jgi:myo-inositol-1(or 4)-monophosphatase
MSIDDSFYKKSEFWANTELSESEERELLNFAIITASKAGNILKRGFFSHKEIAHKSEKELVTTSDIASEKFILSRISEFYPSHNILSEELSPNQVFDVENLWVVDPLDGTNNFAHGFPLFSVSIGYIHRGRLVLGVIRDPIREETFSASQHFPATLNSEIISISDIKNLSDALLVTGFPYDVTSDVENNIDHFKSFTPKVQGIRRLGSAALDLVFVASGRLDGFWELKLKPWDMTAGAIIVRKAGGIVSDFEGNPWRIDSDRIVTANPMLFPQMIEVLRQNGC